MALASMGATRGATALMTAAQENVAEGTGETVDLLLKRGASVNLRTHDGETAFILAVEGADNDCTALRDCVNFDVIEALWRAQRNGTRAVAKWLRQNGARGPLMRAPVAGRCG